MMALEKRSIKMTQAGVPMYLVALAANELIQNTTVNAFSEDNPSGYQRPLTPLHYRKIADYIRDGDGALPGLLPSAIIVSVPVEKATMDDSGNLTIHGPMTVVDGQHRIAAFRYLKETYPSTFAAIEKHKFPVIIMAVDEATKLYEVSSFVNINKKGKRVSTDLAVQLRDRLRDELDSRLIYKDFVDSVATSIARAVNSDPKSLWKDKIRMGGKDTAGRPISINAFNLSLVPVVTAYIAGRQIDLTVRETRLQAQCLAPAVVQTWDLVRSRWPECFFEALRYENNLQFSLQKGIGVFPIHIILADLLKESGGDTEKAIVEMKRVLVKNSVQWTDWVSGGRFSSMNSRAGFAEIARTIRGFGSNG